MDVLTARKLIRETNRFYIEHCISFSETRRKPWDGWKELPSLLGPLCPDIDILDIACGNMRLEEFMAKSMPEHSISAYAIDSCSPLAETRSHCFKASFHEMDILGELDKGRFLSTTQALCPQCVLTTCFGFMHHVPLHEWRKELIRTMVQMTRPMGYTCVSFWQLSKSKKMLEKARDVTERGSAKLGIDLSDSPRDYLLDWKGDESVYRYAHDFSDSEISDLVEIGCEIGASLYRIYSADGRTGNLNRYVILKRNIY